MVRILTTLLFLPRFSLKVAMQLYMIGVRPPLLQSSRLACPHLQRQVIRFPSRDISQAKRPPKPRATPRRLKYEPTPQHLPRAGRTKPPRIRAAQTEPLRPNEPNEQVHGTIPDTAATATASLRRQLQVICKKYLRALLYLAVFLGYLSFAHARETVPCLNGVGSRFLTGPKSWSRHSE